MNIYITTYGLWNRYRLKICFCLSLSCCGGECGDGTEYHGKTVLGANDPNRRVYFIYLKLHSSTSVTSSGHSLGDQFALQEGQPLFCWCAAIAPTFAATSIDCYKYSDQKTVLGFVFTTWVDGLIHIAIPAFWKWGTMQVSGRRLAARGGVWVGVLLTVGLDLEI